jgi:hypothetical protein
MSDHIILISCSNGKVCGGKPAHNNDDCIAAVLRYELQQELWRRRLTIAERIMAGDVEDRLRGDGNRRDNRYNIALQMGADMGVGISEADLKKIGGQKQQEPVSQDSVQKKGGRGVRSCIVNNWLISIHQIARQSLSPRNPPCPPLKGGMALCG